jgi:hypothetical protein
MKHKNSGQPTKSDQENVRIPPDVFVSWSCQLSRSRPGTKQKKEVIERGGFQQKL